MFHMQITQLGFAFQNGLGEMKMTSILITYFKWQNHLTKLTFAKTAH